jgi:ubiquinone/menaquinone biosynthesis C-methylase UbiE
MLIDDVAAYWDGRPCNIRHSNKPVGSKDYFYEVSKRKYFVEHHIPGFANFSIWKDKKVLELGCGIGTAMQSFAESGANYTGVDLSSKSLELANQRLFLLELKKCQLYQANIEKLSEEIPVNKYDLIYSFGVLHHTPNEQDAFGQISTFCKSGTVVKIMLYNRFSTKTFALWLKYGWKVRFSIDKAVALQSEAEFGCPITRTYTKRDAQRLAELGGFQLTKVSIDHIFPYSIKQYVNYKYKKRWYWRYFPKNIFIFLEKRFGWHLLIEGIYL